ncbi:MAG: GNAT family N-acetyltransferase [Eubacteriales bacterium]
MIVKAKGDHHAIIMEYLMQEPEMNLFIIGDIENYGYKDKNIDVWIQLEGKHIIAILMRFYDSLIFHAAQHFDLKGFIHKIQSIQFNYLSGKEEIMDKIDEYFNFKSKKSMVISKLDRSTYKEVYHNYKENIQFLNTENIDRYIELRNSIREFGAPPNRENTLVALKNKFSRGCYIEKDNKMVSIAQTTAENKYAAMIVGVCTAEAYRGKGYASKCVQKLCREVLGEGKSLCLFYENPIAAKIYKNVGFVDIGQWKMNVR